jgi:hypothetical protein
MPHRKAYISAFYLLTLAKNEAEYDFFTSKCLWGLSNYLVLGQVGIENFNTWPRQSAAAIALRATLGAAEWKTRVRFEHCRPLNALYGLIMQRANQLDVAGLLELIGEYPPVIITRVEDANIDARGYRVLGTPEDRYAHIQVGFALRTTAHHAIIEQAINAAPTVRWPTPDARAPVNA